MADKVLPIYCIACDRQNIDSLMVKDTSTSAEGMIVRCLAQSHRFDYNKLMALNPRKVKLQLHEKQPGNTTTVAVWVYPEVLAALQKRYPDNLQTTLCSFLTAIADPDSIVVEGEHARALRDSGVSRGRDIMGLAEIVKQQEQELETARIQMKALGPMMAMFQQFAGGGAGMQPQGAPQQPLIAPGGLQGQQWTQHVAPAPAPAAEPMDPIEAAMWAEQAAPGAAAPPDREPKFMGIPKPTAGFVR